MRYILLFCSLMVLVTGTREATLMTEPSVLSGVKLMSGPVAVTLSLWWGWGR